MSVLTVLCYLGVAVFLGSVIARTVRLKRLPLHLRWELYPVAHEKKRAQYGGSYLEEPEWWTKPRESSKLGELKVMLPEILFLEGVRHSNKSQWWRTWPFHFGLYLLVGTTVLLLIGGLVGATEPGGFFGTLIPILGYAGFGLGLVGAVALLLRRILDTDYRDYTRPIDFVNLSLFVAALGVALTAHLTVDPGFLRMRGFFAGLFRGGSPDLPPIQVVEVLLFALLTAYVPLTHMSHFFTKWFMYHDVRWSDAPMNEKIGQQVRKSLGMRPTWSATHIGADGTKTWGEVATSDVQKGDSES